jgi:hypothetical protein
MDNGFGIRAKNHPEKLRNDKTNYKGKASKNAALQRPTPYRIEL